MRAYSLMIFYLSLNIAAFIISESGAFVGSQTLYINPLDVSNQFSLVIFTAIAGAGTIGGLIALYTRQYLFVAGALLIWIIGLLVPIGQWILIGTPIILATLLPTEISYLSAVVSAFFAFIFFMFLIEIAGQRPIT